MALLNDIQRMQAEGKTIQEIIAELREKGISPRDITEAITQSKIKEAVGSPAQAPSPSQESQYYEPPIPGQSAEQGSAQEYAPSAQPAVEEIQPEAAYPSPADQSAQSYPPQQYQPEAQQQYQQQVQPQPQYQEYQAQQQGYPQEYQAQAPQMGISSDTITEISEQVVTEKLAPIRQSLEKVLDLKTTFESKLEFVDERLKRIEKIIDRLQLSILQKVGDYMTNIEDIKKEIVETQKSFKAISSEAPSISRPQAKKASSQME